MSAIQISIGGRLDRSVQESFASVRKMAHDAGVAVDRDLNRRRGGGGAGQNPELVAARAVHAEQSRLNREIFKQQVAAARAAHGEDLRLSRSRTAERIRELRDEARQHIASNRLVEAAAAREHSAALSRRNYSRDREVDRLATRTSHRATRFMFPNPEGALGYARRTGNELMRGIGVDMSLAGGIARNMEAGGAALKLSNQGWNPDETAWENRIKARDVRAKSQEIGGGLGYSEVAVTEGMQEYTNLTGDLKGAMGLMPKLALLARATGTELNDMGKAAADMGVQLEGVPDKAEVLSKVLSIAAMQGKTGALELFQLAPQMPRIVSQAGFFQGNRDDAMASLLASTQLIRRYGGGGSPSQSSTALVGAVAALNKGGGKTFDKYGVKTADDRGKLRSLEDISIDSIRKANEGGKFNRKVFFDMWNAIRGGKLAAGLETVYDKAEQENAKKSKEDKSKLKRGAAGEEAIRSEYRKFTRPLEKDAQEKLATEQAASTGARAQRFQMALDKITQGMQDKLIPAMEKLAPTALSIASAFGNFLTWATENPGKAIGLAISIAIARAHLESIFRMALDRSIKGAYGGGGVGPGGMPTGAGAGPIGAAGWMSALALGAATFTITDATLNILGKARTEQSASASQGLGRLQDEYQQKRREILSGEGTAEEKKTKLDELAKHTSTNVALTQESQAGIMSRLPDWLRRVIDSGTAIQVDESAKKFQEQIAKDMADSARLLRAASSELAQTAKTKPTVDPSGRSGNGK